MFCNPPYGRQIGKWVQKASEESKKPKTIVVMLIPARTDTKWFHEYIYGKTEIRFIKGRIRFGGGTRNAPFPSMIVVFRGDKNRCSKCAMCAEHKSAYCPHCGSKNEVDG